MNDQLWFISVQSNDKPVKLIFEDLQLTTKTKKYKTTLKEVLLYELKWNWQLRRSLSRQQIHTERGKIKNGNYQEVINFLNKRGVSKEYIENEVDLERKRIVLNQKLNVPVELLSNWKFGIIKM